MERHVHTTPVKNKIRYAIILSVIVLLVEIAGGYFSHSLALLSDAGHVFTDVLALSLTWYGLKQAERPSSHNMTFGYHRVGVLVAITNAISIFGIAAIVLFEAYHRLQNPPEVNSSLMMAVAIAGLVANLVVVFWLRGEERRNLNLRSAFWHAAGDALASIGVIAGGLLIALTGQFWIDPVVSIFISLIIIGSAWGILREGLRVILEASPGDINVNELIKVIQAIPAVEGVHDVHVWSISSELRAMSSHILVKDIPVSQASEIRSRIETEVRRRFNIQHFILQVESQECSQNGPFCTIGDDHK